MFRITPTITLALALAGAASATDASPQLSAKAGVSDSDGYVAQAIEDHVRAQLDWRSYYLNRIAANRGVAPPADISPQRPAVRRTD